MGEEAAKLLGALSEWARDGGGDAAAGLGATVSGLSGLAGAAAEKLGEINDHVATGAAECTWCPVCRTVHAVREAGPEVRDHLVSAAASLLQAVTGVLQSLPTPGPDGQGGPGGPGGPGPRGSGSGPLERIDLDGDDD